MPGNPNNLRQFWDELKRRRVIHVVTVYASATFVIIELVNNLAEPLNLPASLPIIVIIVLAVGFPLAIILSWLYDLTSEGVEKTLPLSEIKEGQKSSVPGAWRIATYVSFAVILGLVLINVMGRGNQLRAGQIQSLVILPFENFTGDEQLEWLVSGMQASLIQDMGRISSFDVLNKTTSNVYKNTGMTSQEIASERDADALIEADVMCHGDTICFQMRLIRAFPEEETIWSEEYREAKSQIQNLYNRIGKQIADEVKIELTAGEEALLAESRTVDPEAYDAYWKGKHYWDQFTEESLERALEYFNLAIEKDPDWGPPYAGVAEFWIAMRQGGYAPLSVTMPNIYENVNKATELDPTSANTHYVNALATVWTWFDWEKGEREFLKAMEINPNHAHSRMFYSHLLITLGRTDEAVTMGQTALDLDPLNPTIQALYGVVLTDAGDYNRAISLFEKALSVEPDHWIATSTIDDVYVLNGDYTKAIEAWCDYYPLEKETSLAILNTFENQGFPAAVEALIVELEKTGGDVSKLDLGQLYTLVKNYPRALDLYEKCYEERDANLPYAATRIGSYGPFQIDDPRFNAMLEKMNLPLPAE
jgi:tetratricopeptide (TPR) repeat protein